MPSAPESEKPSSGAGRALLAALPYAVFVLLALLSWNRWIEPYVDSGRELETPWRISQGQRLYRDVRFYHGPLAPYLSAAIDRAAGPSLPARIGLAAVIAILGLEALRRLAGRLLAPGRAALVTALLVAVAFFQRPGGCHLFPFSLDTAIAVAAITWALLAASGRQSAHGDRVAALALFAALLSRPEMGLAAIAALALERRRARRLILPALLPLAAAGLVYGALSAGTTLATLRREGWLAFVGPPQTFRNIYASYAGLDRPALRLAELALAAVVLLLLASLLAAASALAARSRRSGPAIEIAAMAILAILAAVCLDPPADLAPTLSLFPPIVRVVPPVLVAAAAARLFARLSGREPGRFLGAVPDALLYTAALFAARLLLAAGYVGPYSAFLLPLPLLLSTVGLYRLADRAAPWLGSRLPRLITAALAIFVLLRCADLARIFRHDGWARVQTAAGSLWLTEPVASTTREALQDLAARMPARGTLTGFPEAGFFNYTLRLSNPLPEDQFFPGHLDASAEAAVIAQLMRRPPDAIVYANVLAVGHRAVRFGRDYLTDLDRFVRENFEVAASYGPGAGSDPRVGDPQFFVEIRVPRQAHDGQP
jgi:hypothetical protein